MRLKVDSNSRLISVARD